MSNSNKQPQFPSTQPTQEGLMPWLRQVAEWGRSLSQRILNIENAQPSTQVFTSYNWNDPDNQPDKPPQDGDGYGWSRFSDKDATWMSQKVAPSLWEGEWGRPVLVKGSDGHSALRALILSDAGTVFHRSAPGETPSPTSITLSLKVFYGTMDVSSELDSVEWFWDDGSTAGTGSTLSVTVSDISGQDKVSVEVTWNGITAYDEITLVDVADGADGEDGLNGADGVDGTSIVWQGTYSSHPSSPENGWAYRNSTDGKSYVYQTDAWYQMTVDGVDGQDGQDGLSIVWKGDLASPPSSPEKNWAYRDTGNGKVYIHNGSAWELMVVDGSDGAAGADGSDGLSVYITYHDNDADNQPSSPTGDGTGDGWHTDATSAVVWMSQKVAADASSGTWGTPVQITGENGEDALYAALDFEQLMFRVSGDGTTITPSTITGSVLAFFQGAQLDPSNFTATWHKKTSDGWSQVATGAPDESITVGHSQWQVDQDKADTYVDGELQLKAVVAYDNKITEVAETLYDVHDGAGLSILYSGRPDRPDTPTADGSNWTDQGWHGIPFNDTGAILSELGINAADVTWLGANNDQPSNPDQNEAYADKQADAEGLLSDRPDASTVSQGYTYYATDVDKLYVVVDDGSGTNVWSYTRSIPCYIYVDNNGNRELLQDMWRSEKIENTSQWGEPEKVVGEKGDKGEDGAPGQNTYTAYYPHSNKNDKPNTPSKPPSDLTPSNSPQNGWYWDQDTANNNGHVWFLSIKGSRHEPGDSDWSNDAWSEPIQIRGEKGASYRNYQPRTTGDPIESVESPSGGGPNSDSISSDRLTDLPSIPSGWSKDSLRYVIKFNWSAHDGQYDNGWGEVYLSIGGEFVFSGQDGDSDQGDKQVAVDMPDAGYPDSVYMEARNDIHGDGYAYIQVSEIIGEVMVTDE